MSISKKLKKYRKSVLVDKTELREAKARKKAVSRRSFLPTLSTSLTTAFSHLDGGWPSYIRFVEIAAKDEKDETGEMRKLLAHYQSLPASKQRLLTPEALCLGAGINIKSLLGSIMPWIWIYSNSAAAVIAATANPAVIAKTAQAAMGKGKNAHKDRETFLRVSGALPTASGSRTIINNSPIVTATSQAASGPPIRLPSASQSILELESAEMDELEQNRNQSSGT